MKEAAPVAPVVLQLAKITGAVNKTGALRRVCSSCSSLFSAPVHLMTINYSNINDL
jgi:hypothetical protein